jgi:hypothetical protein
VVATNAPKVQPAPSPAISTAPVFESEGNVDMIFAASSHSNMIYSHARHLLIFYFSLTLPSER